MRNECEHHFLPIPGSRRSLYCEHCGTGREIGVARPPAAPVKRAAKPRRERAVGPMQEGLPFGMPVTIGNGPSLMDAGTPVTTGELAELERGFMGANPLSEAAAIAEMAQRMGTRRPPEGDPEGTYRPGDGEPSAWPKAMG
jgi:hypothetical protein